MNSREYGCRGIALRHVICQHKNIVENLDGNVNLDRNISEQNIMYYRQFSATP